jgi:hypothetical protein
MVVSRIFCRSANAAIPGKQPTYILVILESLLGIRLSLKVDVGIFSLLLLEVVKGKLDKGDLFVSLCTGQGKRS